MLNRKNDTTQSSISSFRGEPHDDEIADGRESSISHSTSVNEMFSRRLVRLLAGFQKSRESK